MKRMLKYTKKRGRTLKQDRKKQEKGKERNEFQMAKSSENMCVSEKAGLYTALLLRVHTGTPFTGTSGFLKKKLNQDPAGPSLSQSQRCTDCNCMKQDQNPEVGCPISPSPCHDARTLTDPRPRPRPSLRTCRKPYACRCGPGLGYPTVQARQPACSMALQKDSCSNLSSQSLPRGLHPDLRCSASATQCKQQTGSVDLSEPSSLHFTTQSRDLTIGADQGLSWGSSIFQSSQLISNCDTQFNRSVSSMSHFGGLRSNPGFIQSINSASQSPALIGNVGARFASSTNSTFQCNGSISNVHASVQSTNSKFHSNGLIHNMHAGLQSTNSTFQSHGLKSNIPVHAGVQSTNPTFQSEELTATCKSDPELGSCNSTFHAEESSNSMHLGFRFSISSTRPSFLTSTVICGERFMPVTRKLVSSCGLLFQVFKRYPYLKCLSLPAKQKKAFQKPRKPYEKHCLKHMWLLFIAKLCLRLAGDVETNPGPNSEPDASSVQETELLCLANSIDPSKYLDIGIYLGFSLAELDRTLVKRLNNIRDALLEVFTQWNVRQEGGNKRELLAEKLRHAELNDLADKLRDKLVIRDSASAFCRPSRPSRSSSISALSAPQHQTQEPASSLTEGQLKECRDDIESFYRTYLCKIREDPLDPASLRPFEDIFTNLKMLAEDGRRWQDLDYREMLSIEVNGAPPRRLMVQGEAGAGKTTLCAKIAWDWVNGTRYTQFELVLVVPLREAENCTIGEIAKSYLKNGNAVGARQLDEYILSNPGKVFVVYDGLDEFSKEILPSGTNVDRSVLGNHPEMSTNIVKTLSSQQLESCLVMVTSRPWKADQVRRIPKLRALYTFVRVEGFNKENQAVYIQKYFRNDDTKASNLIQLVKDNDVIADNMAPFPIYTAMLCLMWRELEEERCRKIEQLQTFSQLFKEMFLFLKEHFILKKVENLDDPARLVYISQIDKDLKSIAGVAFDGLLKRNMVFREKDFDHCRDALVTACKIGVLTSEKKLAPKMQWHEDGQSPVQSAVYFPHKLFQEFVAGMHLAALHRSDHERYQQVLSHNVMPRKEEFMYVLYFGTALSSNVGMNVLTSLSKVHRQRQGLLDSDDLSSQQDFIVDLAFECQDVRVAEQVKATILPDVTSLSIDREKAAHTLLGFMFVLSNLTELVVLERKCKLSLSQGLAMAICTAPSLQKVTFTSCSIHDRFFTILNQKGQNSKVQWISLRDLELGEAASRELGAWLCGLLGLATLELILMRLTGGFYAKLAAGAAAFKAASVDLWDMNLNESSSRDLATWLRGLPNPIDLKLINVDLKGSFYSGQTTGASPTMKVGSLYLKLWETELSDRASRDIAMWLCGLSELSRLQLESTLFADSFYEVLSGGAAAMKIQSLTLVGMNIRGPEESSYLASWIASMPLLKELNAKKVGMYGKYVHLNVSFLNVVDQMASALQDRFPQISTGNFKFNGVNYNQVDLFLQAVREEPSIGLYDHLLNSLETAKQPAFKVEALSVPAQVPVEPGPAHENMCVDEAVPASECPSVPSLSVRRPRNNATVDFSTESTPLHSHTCGVAVDHVTRRASAERSHDSPSAFSAHQPIQTEDRMCVDQPVANAACPEMPLSPSHRPMEHSAQCLNHVTHGRSGDQSCEFARTCALSTNQAEQAPEHLMCVDQTSTADSYCADCASSIQSAVGVDHRNRLAAPGQGGLVCGRFSYRPDASQRGVARDRKRSHAPITAHEVPCKIARLDPLADPRTLAKATNIT